MDCMPQNLTFYLIEKLGLPAGSPGWIAIFVGGILLCMIVPYLLGSLNFGLIISRKRYHDDIRAHGSGNAGSTNMLRTYGKRAAALTMLGDMLKAFVAVGFGYLVAAMPLKVIDAVNGQEAVIMEFYGAAIAGLFVMLGHCFPIFYKFKGGKGVATAAIVILMMDPLTFAICFTVFLVIVIGTRFVSLGSCMGMALYPLVFGAFHRGDNYVAQGMAVLMALLVIFMHRENIKRLMNGQESKISFKKKTAPTGEAAAENTAPTPAPEKSRKKKK